MTDPQVPTPPPDARSGVEAPPVIDYPPDDEPATDAPDDSGTTVVDDPTPGGD